MARLYIPNSIDLAKIKAQITTGNLIVIIGAAHPTNNGVFGITAVDNENDSAGRTGFKEIRIKNTYISRETEETSLNLSASAYTVAFANSEISNPELSFNNALNGYYSDLLASHRIVGTFYTDTNSNVAYVYSLASGREWQGGLGKNVGTIYPVFTDREPPWGLIANGAEVAKADYPELYAEIGDAFGTASSNTMFKLPDARGHFLRFMDLGAGNDPDADSRTRPDGESGDNAGSFQDDAAQGHKHSDSGHTHSSSRGNRGHGGDATNGNVLSSTGASLSGTWRIYTSHANLRNPVEYRNGVPRIANETRPKNFSLMPIIKY